jgi:hypothetical protein
VNTALLRVTIACKWLILTDTLTYFTEREALFVMAVKIEREKIEINEEKGDLLSMSINFLIDILYIYMVHPGSEI